uniref:Uncharacterized protein n=1 Tax=Chromera velia CCMP2878 TaxID=1169474 RepID=A0A0G4FP60_9ALVE|eukprot:Cvel_17871.t1-p1 / transcript=Cvel_17871.t1 / gene=Cvel_17871 / organism=Chromera_velia_CCMP2878 / gene_product=hypothetical protein / transcript_product=hypothetical protein / location=Cvel_scaffold1449:31206-33191(+) / protein_length=335 / sequence_SO=supercontig / SO=protein_coding / is_pseudo=false
MREGGGDSQIPFLLSVYWRVVEHYRESDWQTLYEILRGAAEGGAREIGWRVLSKIIQKKPELLMEPSVVFHMRELEAETEVEKQAFGEREMNDIDALPVGAGEDKGEEGGWALEPRVVHSPSPHGQATVIQGGEGSGAADLARRVRSQSAGKAAASSFPPLMQTSRPNFPFPSSSVSLQKRPASRPASASLQAPVSQLPSCSSYLRAHQKRRQREKSNRSLREDLPSELPVAWAHFQAFGVWGAEGEGDGGEGWNEEEEKIEGGDGGTRGEEEEQEEVVQDYETPQRTLARNWRSLQGCTSQHKQQAAVQGQAATQGQAENQGRAAKKVNKKKKK